MRNPIAPPPVPFSSSEIIAFKKLDQTARVAMARREPTRFLQMAEASDAWAPPPEAEEEKP